jgi:hypothetical protein
MPKALLPYDLVFNRYVQPSLDQATIQFGEILQMMPILYNNQDFNDVLKQETKVLDQRGLTSKILKISKF